MVYIQFSADAVTAVECTCPYYDYGDTWCKQIATTLLAVLEEDDGPQSETAAVADLASGFDRETFIAPLERLTE